MHPLLSELNQLGFSLDAGILAGGLSTRMNGLDKGLQALHNTPLIEASLKALQPFAVDEQVMISCNRNEDKYQHFSPRTYADIFSGYLGPLAGIHALLSHSQADYLLVCPCDTPFITRQTPETLLKQLITSLKAQPAHRPLIAAKEQDKLHPLHTCIPRTALPSLTHALHAKHSKVIKWLESQQIEWVDFANTGERLDNINTPEQLPKL